MKHLLISVLSVSVMLLASAHVAQATVIDMVPVGNPGNTGETQTGGPFGAVAYNYNIGKYEVTNAQYTAFLNAASSTGTNSNGIYNASMGTDARGGITYNAGSANGSKYTTRTNMGDKPVNFVSWSDSLRFCNWLQNGQGSGSTETGAYTMASITPTSTVNPRNSGATWFLPSENEWYKAAYYNKGVAVSTGDYYWLYPTMSNTPPTAVMAPGTGVGQLVASPYTTPVTSGNYANWYSTADWNGQDGNVTTVGTNGGPSAYGAFDMGGNAWERNEALISLKRQLRGGSCINDSSTQYMAASNSFYYDPTTEVFSMGFRVASVSIPEPGSLIMLTGFALTALLYWWRKHA